MHTKLGNQTIKILKASNSGIICHLHPKHTLEWAPKNIPMSDHPLFTYQLHPRKVCQNNTKVVLPPIYIPNTPQIGSSKHPTMASPAIYIPKTSDIGIQKHPIVGSPEIYIPRTSHIGIQKHPTVGSPAIYIPKTSHIGIQKHPKVGKLAIYIPKTSQIGIPKTS